MTKSKIASIVAIGAVFVGSLAAIAYAYDSESSEEAKADFSQSLSDLSSTVKSYDGIDPLTATNDTPEYGGRLVAMPSSGAMVLN
jgi:hypothetical protein